jgi:hypothetical protein
VSFVFVKTSQFLFVCRIFSISLSLGIELLLFMLYFYTWKKHGAQLSLLTNDIG